MEYRRLIAYFHVQRGKSLLFLGLLDKASDELSLAKKSLEALGPSGKDIRSEIGAMRLLEVDVLNAHEAWAD